jgi:3-deoxy-D-manno-octulosonic-acid transferase
MAIFNKKAKKWVEGRKNWQQQFSQALQANEKRILIHCSSTGEFEQARPLIEKIKLQYPEYKILVTFFSPSGYEACKGNKIVDYVFYLPMDSRKNATLLIDMVNPALAMFIKYEFWYHYLSALRAKKIPVLMISGAFRQEQPFFKWYGSFFRKMLHSFTYFFLQDEESKQLLTNIGIQTNVLISGDTRYDRVAEIARKATSIRPVEQFKSDSKILIAGSTHSGDDDIVLAFYPAIPDNWKLIIAPHEISEDHCDQLKKSFLGNAVLFSELTAKNTGADKKVLIINNIGMLSRLFAYADVAFIGGGFQKGGIHNILEPSAFAVPVVFGPLYEKFVEAKEMAGSNLAFPISNSDECRVILEKLIKDETYRKHISDSVRIFMQQHTGATEKIMAEINRQHWLS